MRKQESIAIREKQNVCVSVFRWKLYVNRQMWRSDSSRKNGIDRLKISSRKWNKYNSSVSTSSRINWRSIRLKSRTNRLLRSNIALKCWKSENIWVIWSGWGITKLLRKSSRCLKTYRGSKKLNGYRNINSNKKQRYKDSKRNNTGNYKFWE